ncbi:alpha-1,6-mannosyl-glycoprotein 2-beta-N-acetylglucosaminyltransferase-like [Chironomus tepperi]|uniref:alpha-1,6-mannosyl-glycoprotein 2-beta-N-acetylglucosaminyltransferase-like n=1 Tax=Chironomus tepperi TaxID=113505 RepID=UPI00391F9306
MDYTTSIYNVNITNITSIKSFISNQNRNQRILNDDVFEPFSNESIVVVVQVHKRFEYLRHLINGLSIASNISQTLLIFSHDYFDDEINHIVNSIKFCRVLQIFYPYSIQLHPKEFPGTDPEDCARDVNQDFAKVLKCKSYDSPDSFGHYREAAYAQIKHHWWWKANQVFDHVTITQNYDGYFLFLEEDHYVAPDFLYMIKLMESKALEVCKECNILVLGKHKVPTRNISFINNDVIKSEWVSSKHNMGMAFKRSTWINIKNCSNIFCTYDDYNWDWSIQHISRSCMVNKLQTLSLFTPRVFHIGQCGMHAFKNVECSAESIVSNLIESFHYSSDNFYPSNLKIGYEFNPNFILSKNGGWNDKRDHMLCLNITNHFKN